MMNVDKKFAVLTGDLVDSRQLSSLQQKSFFSKLNNLWGKFGSAHADAVIGKLEVFRGDGWQGVLSDPSLSVNAALFIRASVKALNLAPKMDTRIGVGIGSVDSLNPKRLGESNGKAFQYSGQALDSLAKGDQAWGFYYDDEASCGLKTIGFPMMDLAIQQWSKVEAVAVMGTLLGLTQEKIAHHPLAKKDDETTPSQQAIADALKRIGWKSHWAPVLAHAKECLEKSLK